MRKDLLALFGSVALVGAGAAVATPMGEYLFPVERGEDHLAKNSYENITGGDDLYVFSPKVCGKDYQRNYTAVKDGKKETVRVCYNPFVGTYRSPIG